MLRLPAQTDEAWEPPKTAALFRQLGDRGIEKFFKAEFKGLNITHIFRNVNLLSVFS